MRYPVDNFKTEWNTSAGYEFGDKTDYGFHEADDLNKNGGGNIDLGQPLYAIAKGQITSVHTHTGSPTFGKHLHLKINVGGKDYWVHYAHCNDIFVSEGEIVEEGQKIATVGNTGTIYAHCHFAIKNQPTGIDGLAKVQADLAKWESPIKFIEKHLTAEKKKIEIESDTFEQLVSKSSEYDKFVAGGFPHIEEIQKQLKEKEDTIQNLTKDVQSANDKVSEVLDDNQKLLDDRKKDSDSDSATAGELLKAQHKLQPYIDESLQVRRALNLMDEVDTQSLLKAIEILRASKVKPAPKPTTFVDKLLFLFS